MKRIVITGVGVVTPFGVACKRSKKAFLQDETA